MYTPIHLSQQLNTFMMNSDMSQMTTPTFFLYRTAGPNDAFDPTAEIQFYPQKDSDELFDALRLAYPIAKTHSERMRNAVIDFLVKERDAEQAKHVASTPSTLSSWPSNSTSSTFSSPDLIDLATPASAASPMPTMSRQPSRSSAGRSSMEQMTNVFSLSANSQPKTRVRRKMTDNEKAEYRKRRIVKACDKCSKRKRKCHHNQEQMEVINPSGKLTKRKSPSNSAPSFQIEQLDAPYSFVGELDPLSFLTDDSLFSLQEPTVPASSSLMDFDFDSQIGHAEAWPWSDTQDWTLMDTPSIHDNTVQSEPLFGEFTGYNNQNSIVSPATERQLTTHTWQQHSTQPTLSMGSTVNPELLQAQRTPIETISPMNVGPIVNPDLVHTDKDSGNDGDLLRDVARTSGQPTHSKHYYGGFDRSAFIGASQIASSGHPNETLMPDIPSLNLPLLHGRAATPSRSARPGSVVNDKGVASSGLPGGSIRNEEDQSGSGHGQVPGNGYQSAILSQQSVIKNKGPEHASRASAAAAVQGDGKAYMGTEANVNGGSGRKIPASDIRHQQRGGLATTPSYYSSGEQAAAACLSTDAVTPRRGHAHAAPAFLHDFDFDFTATEAVLSSRVTSTASAGLRSVLGSSRAGLHGQVLLRGSNESSTPQSGSSATRSTAVLSPELIQAFSEHNSAAEACSKQRLASAASAVSTAPMVVTAGLDEGLLSPAHSQISPTASQSSSGGSTESRLSPSGKKTNSAAMQPATSWTGHLPRNAFSANNTASIPKQSKPNESVPTLLEGSPDLHGSDDRIPSPEAVQLLSSNTRSVLNAPMSLFSAAVLKAAKNKRVPAYNTDEDSHGEHCPSPPCPSGTRATRGKANSMWSCAAAGLSIADGAALALGRAYTSADTALAMLSLVSSGYLLGLASALTGELLRSMMQERQKSGVSGRTSVSRGLHVRSMVACV